MFTHTNLQSLLGTISVLAVTGVLLGLNGLETEVARSRPLSDCVGCGPEAGASIVNFAIPNDPDKNGDSDPADESAEDGTFQASDITPPGTAEDSWELEVTGTGSVFESSPGDCIESDKEEPPCEQEASCSWSVADANEAGVDVIHITVTSLDPSGSQTTAPETSANLIQDNEASPAVYSATFSENDAPMQPACNGEIEYVVVWKKAGARQRWEASFRCTKCEPGGS